MLDFHGNNGSFLLLGLLVILVLGVMLFVMNPSENSEKISEKLNATKEARSLVEEVVRDEYSPATPFWANRMPTEGEGELYLGWWIRDGREFNANVIVGNKSSGGEMVIDSWVSTSLNVSSVAEEDVKQALLQNAPMYFNVDIDSNEVVCHPGTEAAVCHTYTQGDSMAAGTKLVSSQDVATLVRCERPQESPRYRWDRC